MFNRLPPVTRALLIANVAVFLLQWGIGEARMARCFRVDSSHESRP